MKYSDELGVDFAEEKARLVTASIGRRSGRTQSSVAPPNHQREANHGDGIHLNRKNASGVNCNDLLGARSEANSHNGFELFLLDSTQIALLPTPQCP